MEKENKILLVITKSELGGAQIFVLNLARELQKKGMRVSLAVGEEGFLSEEFEKLDFPVFKIKGLKRSLNPLKIFTYFFDLYFLLKKEKFNIVHFNSSNTLPGALSAKILSSKIKIVFTFHGLSLLDPQYKKSFFLKTLNYIFFKIFLFFVDSGVFVSNLNLAWAKKIGLYKKGVCIYNGINNPEKDFLEKEKAISELDNITNKNLADHYILGTVGRLDYPKNHKFLLEMMDDIIKIKQHAKIIIIGDGPEKKNLKSSIKEKNLEDKIILAGAQKNAYKYLKAFDIFVMPSRYEGLSISLIEALFSGVPILASDVGGNSEVLMESPEQLYELNDKKDFLNKFTTLQKGEVEERVISKNNKNKSKFRAEEMAEKYLGVYDL